MTLEEDEVVELMVPELTAEENDAAEDEDDEADEDVGDV